MVALPETKILRRYILSGELNQVFQRGGYTEVREQLSADPAIDRSGIDWDLVWQPFEETRCPFTDVELYRRLQEVMAGAKNATRVVDKDPRLVEVLPELNRLFPESYVVHIIRDPRDIMASKKKAAWSSHQSSFRQMLAHRIQFESGRCDGNRLFRERYVEVVYENLVERPEATLNRLCIAIGETFDPAMLHFQETARQLIRTDEVQWHHQTLEPLKSDNRHKWKQSLRLQDVALAERAGAAVFATIPSKPIHAHARLNWPRRIWIELQVHMISLFNTIYRLRRRRWRC